MHFVGEIDRVHYHHNGWAVFTFKTEDPIHPRIKVCGPFPEAREGTHLRVDGAFETHPKYGPSFKAHSYAFHVPSTDDGLKRYLAATLPGIGVSLANAIVDKFGSETVNVLTNTPERLLEIPRIKPQDVEEIRVSWQNDHTNRELVIFLSQFELSRNMADRVIARYGKETKEIITEDPYLLLNVSGMGFVKVDRVALKIGVAPDGVARRRAALMYVLGEASQGEGNVFLRPEDLCSRLLDLKLDGMDRTSWTLARMLEFVKELHDRGQVVHHDGRIYLAQLYHAEINSAHKLQSLLSRPVYPDYWHGGDPDVEDDPYSQEGSSEQLLTDELLGQFIEEYQKDHNLEFSQDQIDAIFLANQHRVVLITGLPGTGKTTVMRAVATLFKKCNMPVHLCAPTGKAAKRMSEVSRMEAYTIHRLMKLDLTGKVQGEALEPGAVIVDEFSMVDISLLARLLHCLHKESHLVMIGDPAQLPSVGPGYVLHDLRRSGKIPHVHLDQIFRQAEKSDIIKNAHHIHKGEALVGGGVESDFNIYKHDNDDTLLDALEKIVQQLHHKKRPEDFQVLAPMRKGVLGIENLNRRLRRILNPGSETASRVTYGDIDFTVGDKVLITKNDYTKEVFNGDSGFVVDIDPKYKRVAVTVDSRVVLFEGKELSNLTHAYALTIHKSQGSEWPIVLVALTQSHARMLERNLFYTGVTRARQRVILLCDERAVGRAIGNQRAIKRNTTLKEFLTGAQGDETALEMHAEDLAQSESFIVLH